MAVGILGLAAAVQPLVDQAQVVRKVGILRRHFHGFFIGANSALVIADLRVGKRQVVQRVRPVGGAAIGVAEGLNRMAEIGLLQISNAQRVIGKCAPGVQPHGPLQKFNGLVISFIKDQHAAPGKGLPAFQERRTRRQHLRRLKIEGAGSKIQTGLGNLVAAQVAQQNLLSPVFQGDAQPVFQEQIVFLRQSALQPAQGLKGAPGGFRKDPSCFQGVLKQHNVTDSRLQATPLRSRHPFGVRQCNGG